MLPLVSTCHLGGTAGRALRDDHLLNPAPSLLPLYPASCPPGCRLPWQRCDAKAMQGVEGDPAMWEEEVLCE
eukprot:6047639-Prymnesium_polylepis.2